MLSLDNNPLLAGPPGGVDDPAVRRHYYEEFVAKIDDPVKAKQYATPERYRQWVVGRAQLQAMSYRDQMPWQPAPQYGLPAPEDFATNCGLKIRLYPQGFFPTVWVDVVKEVGDVRLSEDEYDQIKVYETSQGAGQNREIPYDTDRCGTRFWRISTVSGTHEVWYGRELLKTFRGKVEVSVSFGAVEA